MREAAPQLVERLELVVAKLDVRPGGRRLLQRPLQRGDRLGNGDRLFDGARVRLAPLRMRGTGANAGIGYC
jgi:hypothetical protein